MPVGTLPASKVVAEEDCGSTDVHIGSAVKLSFPISSVDWERKLLIALSNFGELVTGELSMSRRFNATMSTDLSLYIAEG